MNRTTRAMSCSAALDMVVPVNRCPRNNLEWDERASLFNCSSINQTCVEPDKFQYHCVLNENCTELVEVCAPVRVIYGNVLF